MQRMLVLLSALILVGRCKTWQEEFREAAAYIMRKDGLTPFERCNMANYVFDKIISEDRSNGYVCVCFEAPGQPEQDGHVFWSFDQTSPQTATHQVDNNRNLVMFGIEVNYAILLRRQNNWFHTRWNISHSEPDFDTVHRYGTGYRLEYAGCGKVFIVQMF